MSIIKNIKEYFEEKFNIETPEKVEARKYENLKFLYELITTELSKYQKMRPEFRRAEEFGHPHYLKKEIEEKILTLIEEDENVLTIQDENGYNIGMKACELKLDNIVMRSLENKEASIQQNEDKKNIGMMAVSCGLENCVLKALDNKEASLQQDKNGRNLAMTCAYHKQKKETEKAILNREACFQRDTDGKTIIMYAIESRMEDIAITLLDDIELSYITDNYQKNVGHYAVNNRLEKVVDKCLEDIRLRNRSCRFEGSFRSQIKVKMPNSSLVEKAEKFYQLDNHNINDWYTEFYDRSELIDTSNIEAYKDLIDVYRSTDLNYYTEKDKLFKEKYALELNDDEQNTRTDEQSLSFDESDSQIIEN